MWTKFHFYSLASSLWWQDPGLKHFWINTISFCQNRQSFFPIKLSRFSPVQKVTVHVKGMNYNHICMLLLKATTLKDWIDPNHTTQYQSRSFSNQPSLHLSPHRKRINPTSPAHESYLAYIHLKEWGYISSLANTCETPFHQHRCHCLVLLFRCQRRITVSQIKLWMFMHCLGRLYQ